jgi:hypothetical protein
VVVERLRRTEHADFGCQEKNGLKQTNKQTDKQKKTPKGGGCVVSIDSNDIRIQCII